MKPLELRSEKDLHSPTACAREPPKGTSRLQGPGATQAEGAAPGSSTGNAAGPASAACAGMGFTGCGRERFLPPRTWQKSSSCFLSELLGPKKLLGSSEQNTPAASSPASKDDTPWELLLSPPSTCLFPNCTGRDGRAGTWPNPTTKHAIKRPTKAPGRTARLREPLQRGCLQQAELHAPALGWGRPCRPRSVQTPRCTTRPLSKPSCLPGRSRGQQRSSKQRERSRQYVSLHEAHRNRRHLSSLLLFPVPGAVAETHAQNRGEPHQP